MEEQEFMAYSAGINEISGVTLIKCRDLMIESFFELHKRTTHRSHSWISPSTSVENFSHTTVMGTVRMIFSELNVDFRRPSAKGLTKVLTLLSVKAISWNIPEEAIQQCRRHLQRLINLAWEGPAIIY